MTEQQVEEILREVYGVLLNNNVITQTVWSTEIEPRIKSAAKRIAKLSN